jgi:serine protease Do
MNGVDLARFEFDYDTTWQAFFLDADLNVYSRYGGRDEASADGRLSKESLLVTMREVLDAHELQGKSGRDDKNLHPLSGKRTIPEEIPLLKAGHQGCVHCHQVEEYRLLQSFHDGKFSRDRLFTFPLPENIGIRFDRAHGHLIESVVPDSPAARAGLAAGDVVTRVSAVPIHSEQDVRWALHRDSEGRRPTVTVSRAANDSAPSRTIRATLDLAPNWRETELDWRKSLRSVPLPLGFLGYPLGREERQKGMLPDDRLAIRVVSVRGAGMAANVGLEKGDLIISLAGRLQARTLEQLKSDLLRHYSPGNLVRLSVLRDGKKVELAGPFPNWHTTDRSVP